MLVSRQADMFSSASGAHKIHWMTIVVRDHVFFMYWCVAFVYLLYKYRYIMVVSKLWLNGLHFVLKQTLKVMRFVTVMSHWSVPLPGHIMTQMSPVMLTEHFDRVALEVISLDMRVRLREPCGIIHLINVSRQLMNIHTFHLTDCEESEKES